MSSGDGNQATLPIEDDVEELPEDDNDTSSAPGEIPVNLLALNQGHQNIALTRIKTVIGRNAEDCTEGAVLTDGRISKTHCEISSRSMTDGDAAIWIKDISSNGVWVNDKKIAKDEPVKIFDKDVIRLAPAPANPQVNPPPVYMLMDKRIKSTAKSPQQSVSKRVNDDLKDESAVADNESSEPEQKRQKSETAAGVSAEDKEQEDSAFEQEFECGICHEIMHKAMIMQPCLHSFCRGCSKSWLKQSTVCPSCRQEVTKTKRDFKLNNLIALFLKTRPHMGRDDMDEEDGADSDASDLVAKRPGHRNQDYDDEDDEDEEDEDEDGDVHLNFNFNHNLQPLPPGFLLYPVTCPCCDPNNAIGYTCPDDVRLAPLPANATWGDYNARIQPQPGHTRCRTCNKHVPLIPENLRDLADRYRCKMCHVPTCGCFARSVDESIAMRVPVEQYLNPFEMGLTNEYLRAQNRTSQDIWQEIKTGMDNGTFYYLGTGAVPNTPPAARAAAVAAAAVDPDPAPDAQADPADPADPVAPAPAQQQQQQQQAAVQVTPATRARDVKSSDRLCHYCAPDFFRNGPLYQWRKSLDPTLLPARAGGRSDCWYGRQCRTQYNPLHRQHAERLNHICENTRGR
ncbi:hypothetical protein BGX29_000308 [Mortierella sp. GBA35]|nr:hypothetical protein BGX29_000308 [Mortierella sp. GBA35]